MITPLELSREWHSGKSAEEIAAKYGTNKSRIYSLARKHHLPARGRGETPGSESPTAEEIEIRAAEVRSRWSEQERERRIVGGSRSVHWKPPAFTRSQIASGA
jgi:hypothetical protein